MEWKKVKLKDMAGINGIFKDGDWVESKDQDPSGDVRLIQMADIGERVYKNKSQRFMTSESFDKLNCTEIIKGDILISRMPDPIGRACIFEGDEKKCATVVDICIIRVDQDIVNSRWLMHRINAIDIRTQIEMKATGTTRKRIARSKLGEIEIPLPPMEIQIKIASALDKAQELIDGRKAQVEKYDELLQSVFLDMFGDPVTNPKGWENKRLDYFGQWQSGGTPARSNKEYYKGNISWLSSGELNQLYTSTSKEKISLKAVEESGAKLIEKGSILLGMYDTAGLKSTILKEVCTCNQAIAFSKLDEKKVNTLYFYHNIQISKEYLKSQQRGVRQKNFNISMIKAIKIIYPPLHLQNQFATVVERVEMEKKLLEESLGQMEENFNSIMWRAFRGEIF